QYVKSMICLSKNIYTYFYSSQYTDVDYSSFSWEEAKHDKHPRDAGTPVMEKLEIEDINDPVELRSLLIDAIEGRNIVLQEKERLEQRAAQLARDNASLKAAFDEGEGSQVVLKERLKVVEAQLAH
ncbi:hypothetical protein L9F63_011683, partial [Diploptera punctata]